MTPHPPATRTRPIERLASIRSSGCESLIAFLEDTCRGVDLPVAGIPTSDLFVDPTVVTSPATRPMDSNEGSLDSTLKRRSVELPINLLQREIDELAFTGGEDRSWSEIICEPALRLILLGAPGGGKTAAGRVAVIRKARTAIEALASGDAIPDQVEIPVWVSASRLADQPPHMELGESLVSALESDPRWGGTPLSEDFRDWLSQNLDSSRSFVVVDGLDEVASAGMAANLIRRCHQLEASTGSVMVTCRTADWSQKQELVSWSATQDGRTVELKPFTISQQRRYFKNRFPAPIAASLDQRLRDEPSLENAARNPLVLTYATELLAAGEAFREPFGSLEALYQGILDAVLSGRWRAHDQQLPEWCYEETKRESCLRFLNHLAWGLFNAETEAARNRFHSNAWEESYRYAAERQESFLAPEVLLRDLIKLGVLVGAGPDPKGNRTWSFSHRTLLEFLASGGLLASDENLRSLLKGKPQKPGSRPDALNPFWFRPEWRQLMTFLASRMEQVAPLLNRVSAEPEDLFHQMLSWKMRIASAAPSCDEPTLKTLADEWLGRWKSSFDDPSESLRDWLLQGLGQIEGGRLRQAIGDSLWEILEDHSIESRREIAVVRALGQLRDPRTGTAVAGLLDKPEIPEVIKKETIACLEPLDDEFCIEPVSRIAGEEGNSLWLREVALRYLGSVPGDKAAKLLREIADSAAHPTSLRIAAIDALPSHGETAAASIERILESAKDLSLKRAAVDALCRGTDRSIVSLLEDIALSGLEETGIRIRATRSWLRFAPSAAIPLLREWLADPAADESQTSFAAIELARRGEKALLESLEPILREDISDRLRFTIAHAFTILGEPAGTRLLIDLIKCPETAHQVRRDAIETLGELGDRSLVSELIEILNDSELDDELRSASAAGLGHFEPYDVAETLQSALYDKRNPYPVRRAAAHSLIRLSIRIDASPLYELLRDATTATWIRRDSAEIIGKLGDESAIPILREVLQDTDNGLWLRRTAANALWQISQHYRVRLEPLV